MSADEFVDKIANFKLDSNLLSLLGRKKIIKTIPYLIQGNKDAGEVAFYKGLKQYLESL